MVSVAISFLVIIIAVAVSSGFRTELRDGLSAMTGDVLLTHPTMSYLDESNPINTSPSYISLLEDMDEVSEIRPAVFRAGIVKHEEQIYGVLVKGMPGGVHAAVDTECADTVKLAVAVPKSFADASGLGPGDRMLTYFVGDRMKASSVPDALAGACCQALGSAGFP